MTIILDQTAKMGQVHIDEEHRTQGSHRRIRLTSHQLFVAVSAERRKPGSYDVSDVSDVSPVSIATSLMTEVCSA